MKPTIASAMASTNAHEAMATQRTTMTLTGRATTASHKLMIVSVIASTNAHKATMIARTTMTVERKPMIAFVMA